MTKAVWILGVLVLAVVLIFVPFLLSMWRGHTLARTAHSFSRESGNNHPSILMIGDSTAFGTGAVDPSDSVAGRFGKDFPDAKILNYGKNGLRTTQLADRFSLVPKQKFDLVIIQIGGNDVVHFSKTADVERELPKALEQARKYSDHIVLLYEGNLGNAPIFGWPFNVLMTKRSRIIRSVFSQVLAKTDIAYVDMFVERSRDPWRKDQKHFYATDNFHPSGAGYADYYSKIRAAMATSGIVL